MGIEWNSKWECEKALEIFELAKGGEKQKGENLL